MLFWWYKGKIGQYSQAKQWGWTKGPWPKKTEELLLHMLKNSESDAESKDFYADVDSLVTEHSQMKMGPKMYSQIYQTHDWINPYMGSPVTLR